MNGRVWIKSATIKQTIFLYEAINNYSVVAEEDTEMFIKNLSNKDKFQEE